MILFIRYPDMEQQWFKVTEVEDLNPIFDMYPMTHEIASSSIDLKEALESIAEYLSNHNMTAWVESEDLSKSLRTKATALGLAFTTAVVPNVNAHKPMVTPTHVPAAVYHKKKSDFGQHPMDKFLWTVRQIESSGGMNTQHKPIKSGQFRGMKAMGQWGLLKPTVDEIVSRMRLSGKMTPEYAKLEGMNRDKLESHLKQHPDIELNLARNLAQHVMSRQKGNPHRAAYAWLHGHNLFPSEITKDKLIGSDYVNKYKSFDKLNPFQQKKVKTSVAMTKSIPSIDDEDFRMRIKNWYKRREEQARIVRNPSSEPDPGRLREPELDEMKPNSLKSPEERLRGNIKQANEVK